MIGLLLQWAAGLYHGLGCESFAQGSTFTGNFQQGRRHGFGVCEYQNGDYYEGEWVMGVRQGLGMQQCTDNSNYAGQYSRGLRHGFGAYSFPNGDRYLGQCDSDLPHGYGTYLFATGQAYEGQWANGKKHGWCVYSGGWPTVGRSVVHSVHRPCPGNNTKESPLILFVPLQSSYLVSVHPAGVWVKSACREAVVHHPCAFHHSLYA